MKDLIPFLQNMRYKQIDLYEQKLPTLLQEILYLFSKIYSCEDIVDAKCYFDVLNLIQEKISLLVKRYNITIPINRLEKFIVECKNLEQDPQRRLLFEKIKTENYLGHLAY